VAAWVAPNHARLEKNGEGEGQGGGSRARGGALRLLCWLSRLGYVSRETRSLPSFFKRQSAFKAGRGQSKQGNARRRSGGTRGAKSGAERKSGMAKAQAVWDTKAAWQKRRRCGIQRRHGKSAGGVGYKGGMARAQVARNVAAATAGRAGGDHRNSRKTVCSSAAVQRGGS